jgi:hypothetical protein
VVSASIIAIVEGSNFRFHWFGYVGFNLHVSTTYSWSCPCLHHDVPVPFLPVFLILISPTIKIYSTPKNLFLIYKEVVVETQEINPSFVSELNLPKNAKY